MMLQQLGAPVSPTRDPSARSLRWRG